METQEKIIPKTGEQSCYVCPSENCVIKVEKWVHICPTNAFLDFAKKYFQRQHLFNKVFSADVQNDAILVGVNSGMF